MAINDPNRPLRAGELPDLLTVGEAASYLRKTDAAVRQMIVRGQVSAVRVDTRSIRIRREELLGLVRDS